MGSSLVIPPKKDTVGIIDPTVQFVLEAINQDKVVIFSKSYCPFCIMAKNQFRKLSQPVTSIEINYLVEETEEILRVLGDITGAKSVPQVFINGKFIGGGTRIKALYEDGKLQKLLNINTCLK